MLTGTVVFAHQNRRVLSAVERMLTSVHPGLHIERAVSGAELLAIQAVLRPDVIVMGMEQPDMTGEHLLCELERDVSRPFVAVYAEKCSAKECSRILRLGASKVIQEPVDEEQAERMIEEQLRRRNSSTALQEAVLQRLFADSGIPFDLKGYRYLREALVLLGRGEARLEPIQSLYERIGEKYGCTPGSVEKNIRYANRLCADRGEASAAESNRKFIARLMEQNQTGGKGMCRPRVSVFGAERRIFS